MAKCRSCDRNLESDPMDHQIGPIPEKPIGRIKIISAPPSEAPKWVRKAWIGLVLPVLEHQKLPTREIRSGKFTDGKGYQVNAEGAMELLQKNNSKAAGWWKANVPAAFHYGRCLVFPKNCAKFIPII